MNIPGRMYSSEVEALAKVSMATLKKRQKQGMFPRPVDRGRQEIYIGEQVYAALGLLSKQMNLETDQQRWAMALEELS